MTSDLPLFPRSWLWRGKDVKKEVPLIRTTATAVTNNLIPSSPCAVSVEDKETSDLLLSQNNNNNNNKQFIGATNQTSLGLYGSISMTPAVSPLRVPAPTLSTSSLSCRDPHPTSKSLSWTHDGKEDEYRSEAGIRTTPTTATSTATTKLMTLHPQSAFDEPAVGDMGSHRSPMIILTTSQSHDDPSPPPPQDSNHPLPQHRDPSPGICWGAVANLCAATLGAGLLALPFAFAKAGWVGGFLLLIGSAVATQVSITMIVAAAATAKIQIAKEQQHSSSMLSYRSDSYESLVEYLLGRPWRRLVEVCLVVFCFGCIIGYTITVGDLLEAAHFFHAIHSHKNNNKKNDPTDNDDHTRILSMVMVWLLVMFPLSLLRRMKNLQWASAVGIASIGTLVVATLANLVEDATNYAIPTTHNHTLNQTNYLLLTTPFMKQNWSHHPTVDVGANLVDCLWPSDWMSFVRALPLILFAFSCQVNVCAIYDELPSVSHNDTNVHQEPNHQNKNVVTTNHSEILMNAIILEVCDEERHQGDVAAVEYHHRDTGARDLRSEYQHLQKVQEYQVAVFRHVGIAAVAICALLYASIAMIGVMNFGHHVFPNILANYQVPLNAMMQTAFAGTALAVIMAYPLNVFPVRITLRQLLCTRSPNNNNDYNMSATDSHHDYDVITTSDANEITPLVNGNNLTQPLLQHPIQKLPLHQPPEAYLKALERVRSDEAENTAAVADQPSQPQQQRHAIDESWCSHVLLTLLIAGSSLGLALILPNISVVFGLLGGSTTSILGFIIPGFLGLAALEKKEHGLQTVEESIIEGSSTTLHAALPIRRWQCWVLIFGGAMIGIVTTGVTIMSSAKSK